MSGSVAADARDARAGLVGATFGLVFVLVNAGALAPPCDVVLHALLCFAALPASRNDHLGTKEGDPRQRRPS